MDVTLRSGRDRFVRIIECPGLWMDDAALAALTADLRVVAGKTLGQGDLTYGVVPVSGTVWTGRSSPLSACTTARRLPSMPSLS